MIKTRWFSLFKLNVFKFGDQKITQFVIFECKYLFSIIVFYFHKSNGIQDRYHTHAFNALSIKLFGKYTEYYLNKEIGSILGVRDRVEIFRYIPRNNFHLIGNSTGCSTILFSGPWKSTWEEFIIKTQEFKTYNWGRKRL